MTGAVFLPSTVWQTSKGWQPLPWHTHLIFTSDQASADHRQRLFFSNTELSDLQGKHKTWVTVPAAKKSKYCIWMYMIRMTYMDKTIDKCIKLDEFLWLISAAKAASIFWFHDIRSLQSWTSTRPSGVSQVFSQPLGSGNSHSWASQCVEKPL